MAIDKELADGIQLLRRGEEAGFNILYSHTYNYVYGRARLIMKNEEDALDLTQETYIRAYKGIQSLEDPNNIFAWLGAITYKQGMTALKKKRDVLVSEEAEGVFDIIESSDADLQPEESAEARATSEIVMEMINELPELQRAVVMAYYYDEMKVEDIATAFECSTGTIKSRLNYARKFLKEKVMEHEAKNRYKLHSVSPAIIIMALRSLLATEEYTLAPEAASSVYSKICGTVGVTPSVVTTAAKAGLSLGVKLAIAITTVAAVGTLGTAVVVHNINNNNSQETTTTTEADYIECEINGDTLIIRGKGAMPDHSPLDNPESGEASVYNSTIKNVIIEEGITSIGLYSFSKFVLLENIVIPDSLTTINSSAFQHCPNLRSITIPASVTSIDPEAFTGCTYLKTICSEKGSAAEDFAKEQGIPFADISTPEADKPTTPTNAGGTIDGTDITWKLADNTLIISGEGVVPSFGEFYTDDSFVKPDSPWYQYADEIHTVIFEEGITGVGAYTFYGFDNLTEVIFPESMCAIDGYSFSYCKSLRTITIPGHIDQTGIRAFYACTGLESVTFEKGISRIGASTFAYCTSLTDISLPEGLEVIDDGAFANCFTLSSVSIPDGTQSLVRNAFRWCISLTEITLPASITDIAPTAFDSKYLKTIYCTAGSAAEAFAKENNIAFIAQ